MCCHGIERVKHPACACQQRLHQACAWRRSEMVMGHADARMGRSSQEMVMTTAAAALAAGNLPVSLSVLLLRYVLMQTWGLIPVLGGHQTQKQSPMQPSVVCVVRTGCSAEQGVHFTASEYQFDCLSDFGAGGQHPSAWCVGRRDILLR